MRNTTFFFYKIVFSIYKKDAACTKVLEFTSNKKQTWSGFISTLFSSPCPPAPNDIGYKRFIKIESRFEIRHLTWFIFKWITSWFMVVIMNRLLPCSLTLSHSLFSGLSREYASPFCLKLPSSPIYKSVV